MAITIKSPEEIEKMREAGKAAAQVLDMITPYVKEGISTEELDNICQDYMVNTLGVVSACLGYRGSHGAPDFPKSICTSVNHQVCHGIPSAKKLKNGDIVNLDITVIKNGFHGDTSRMFMIGKPSVLAERLVRISKECMEKGIAAVKPGAKLGDIGYAVQQHAEAAGYSVVRDFCGHGIGRAFHEDPQVLHVGKPNTGIELKPGMTFTIEPMINVGHFAVRILADGWTVVTKDRTLSAQWEHTILVTETGHEILTLSPQASILDTLHNE